MNQVASEGATAGRSWRPQAYPILWFALSLATYSVGWSGDTRTQQGIVPTARIAAILGGAPDELRMDGVTWQEDTAVLDTTCMYREYRWSVTSAPADGTLRLTLRAGTSSASLPIGLEMGRTIAELVLRRAFPDSAPAIRFPVQYEIPAGAYLFVWNEEMRPGVLTGSTATVILTRQGQLMIYSERRVAASSLAEVVTVDSQEARRLGYALAQRRMDAGERIVLTEAALVLSSLLAPSQGPAWHLHFRCLAPSETSERPLLVVLDALTGQELRLAKEVR